MQNAKETPGLIVTWNENLEKMKILIFLINLLEGRVFVKKKIPISTDGTCSDSNASASSYCDLGSTMQVKLDLTSCV